MMERRLLSLGTRLATSSARTRTSLRSLYQEGNKSASDDRRG